MTYAGTEIAPTTPNRESDTPSAPADPWVIPRFAFGITSAVGLSQLVGWPAGFISAVFLAMLLQAPRPLAFTDGLTFLIVMAGTLAVGMTLGAFLQHMPYITIILLIFLFCAAFYWAQSGVSQLLVLLVIIGLTVMPVLAAQSLDLAIEAGKGILTSGMVAVLLSWLMFGLLPPRMASVEVEPAPAEPKEPDDRLANALVMTAIMAPLVVAFLAFGWTQLIVLIIPAILVQQLSFSAGVKGILAMVAANIAGGALAIAVYYLIVGAPHFIMLMGWFLFVSLIFAKQIFSGGAHGSPVGQCLYKQYHHRLWRGVAIRR